MTKVLTVRVPVVLLSQADAKAARLGLDRTQYVRQLIQQDVAEEAVRSRGFKSEDLAGQFRLGGSSATNERVRQQWRLRQRSTPVPHHAAARLRRFPRPPSVARVRAGFCR